MIEYKSLKDQVYDHLFQEIYANTLKAGEHISEAHLCESLGVSRTPVREALVELAKEGYLEKKPRHGFRIRRLSLNEIKEAYQIIGCLEAFAARSALPVMTEADLREMADLLDKMDDCIRHKDHETYYLHQDAFHDVFVRASGIGKLNELIASMKNRYVRQLHVSYRTKDDLFQALATTNEEHRNILRFLRERKVAELETLLRDVHWKIISFRE